MKKLDDKIFYIGNELRVSSLSKWMGCMLYNTDAFIALLGGLKHWMKFLALHIEPN